MKHKLILIIFAMALPACAQAAKSSPPPTLKSILLEQLRSTHNRAEWFVAANTAVEGPDRGAGQLDRRQGKPFGRPVGYSSYLLGPPKPGDVQGRAPGKIHQ
jgi:hypothetical protein